MSQKRQVETPAEGNTNSAGDNPEIQRIYFCGDFFYDWSNDIETIETIPFVKLLKQISKKGIVGLEISPTTGNKHIQYFIGLKTKKRWKEVKNLFNSQKFYPNINICIGNEEQNVIYCKKEGLYHSWNIKDPPPPPPEPQKKPLKHCCMLNTWQTHLVDFLLNTEPSWREVLWFWSDKGKIGKTQFIRYMTIEHTATFGNVSKYGNMMNLVFGVDWDIYNIFFLTVTAEQKNKISYSGLESLKDGLISNMKSYKNQSKIINPPHIVVFANHPPDYEKIKEDRWFVFELNSFFLELKCKVKKIE